MTISNEQAMRNLGWREMTADERRISELALGRILRLGSRPAQPGDAAEFERCKAIITRAAAGEPDTLARR